MKAHNTEKEHLLKELAELRQRISELEKSDAEHQQSDEELRDSEERYKALIETTSTGYVILDIQGRVIDANMEYVRLTGRTSLNDIIGKSVLDWTAECDIGRNAEEVKKCLETGCVKALEIDYKKKWTGDPCRDKCYYGEEGKNRQHPDALQGHHRAQKC